MRRTIFPAFLLLLLAGPLWAQQDDFKRERRGETAATKDAIENKLPPALQVDDWMNIEGEALKLQDLRGKVVILDFWATW